MEFRIDGLHHSAWETLTILGIFDPTDKHARPPRWLIEEALKRRPGPPLTESQAAVIKEALRVAKR